MPEWDFRVTCKAGRQDGDVSARLCPAAGDSAAWVVLAPGAGAGHDHPFMVSFARGLAARGLHTVTFNFPYIESGRRVPDPNATLEACWLSVLEAVRAKAGAETPLFAGGKSMGGRMTSLAAAKEPLAGVRGLIFFGFPLHAAGKPSADRAKHLEAVALPLLFLQGSRDSLADLKLLKPLAARLQRAELFFVEGGDHSFHMLKSSGRSDEEVLDEVAAKTAGWIDSLVH
jgi:uncharacterized protein